MKLQFFSVYDSAVQLFAQPFYLRGRGEAFRAFQDECNRPDSSICRHAKDYSLFYLGTFDEDGAKFDFPTAPERIALAIDLQSPVDHPVGGRLMPLSLGKE